MDALPETAEERVIMSPTLYPAANGTKMGRPRKSKEQKMTAFTARQISEVLSTRATKVLRELGVHTVGQLGDLNPSRIPPVLGAGRKTIREIVAFQEGIFGPYSHPVREDVAELNPDARLVDGLEDALIGYVEAGRTDEYDCPLAVYDADECVRIIMDSGKIREDAEEHLKRTLQKLAGLGDNAPVFIVRSNEAPTYLAEANPTAMLADGLEDGLIGHTHPEQGTRPVAVYDSEKCVEAIMAHQVKDVDEDEDEDEDEEEDLMKEEDAESHLSCNFYKALPFYYEDAPIFIRPVTPVPRY